MNIQYICVGDYFIPDLTRRKRHAPSASGGGCTEGITEALKASDPMSWVQRMNNVCARAEEIIREELIYA